MQKIPGSTAVALVLRSQDIPYKEIASLLKIARTTLPKQVARARKKILEALTV